ncbi:MAG TPA: hypothetical protein VFU92_01900 [Usitatibacter sp.]|jgi:hypothetical protein|nr:hypothetical protein [Usitatibacter sp.]
MRRRKPKTIWDELRSVLEGRPDDDDEGEQAQDPALLFHALFTVPLVISLFVALRRLTGA